MSLDSAYPLIKYKLLLRRIAKGTQNIFGSCSGTQIILPMVNAIPDMITRGITVAVGLIR